MNDNAIPKTHSKAVLCNADKNTILAALTYYLENEMADPDMRSPGVHAVATGALDDLKEDTSLDAEGVTDLIHNIKGVDGIEFR